MGQESESIHYVMRKLLYSARSQFKIGNCKIESERWVPPADRPFQYFMPMEKHDNELEQQHFLRKELDERKKQQNGQERRDSDQKEKWGDYDDD